MSREEIKKKLVSLLEAHFEMSVSPSIDLIEDFDILERVEMSLVIEEGFEIVLLDEESEIADRLDSARTIDDMVEVIEAASK